MALADPKTYARTKAVDEDGDTDDLRAQLAAMQQQIAALLQAQTPAGGIGEDKLEAILLRVAQMSADAQERAANPSNKVHPGKSVYSYPEGDVARPRPDLKCRMFWAGYPVDKDILTAAEIELLNQAEPGAYDFKRTDRRIEAGGLIVTGDRSANGTWSRLLFDFQTKEGRETLPSMEDMLRSAFKVKSPEELEMERLRAEVAALREAVAQ